MLFIGLTLLNGFSYFLGLSTILEQTLTEDNYLPLSLFGTVEVIFQNIMITGHLI